MVPIVGQPAVAVGVGSFGGIVDPSQSPAVLLFILPIVLVAHTE